MDRDLEAENDRNHQQGDPRAVRELRSQDDDEHEAGHHEADDVDGARAQDGHAFLAGLARAQLPVPVLDHAQLREREGNEYTDDVELDEARRLCLEADDQRDRCGRQDDDTVRVGQSVAAAHHLVGQEGIARQDGCQRREAIERRVAREHQDEASDDGDEDEEDRSLTEHRGGDLRDRRIDRRVLRDGRASTRIEIIIEAAIRPSIASVVAALRDLGRRNMGRPLEMASTPVSAAQPEENARMSRKAPASPARPSALPGAATRS